MAVNDIQVRQAEVPAGRKQVKLTDGKGIIFIRNTGRINGLRYTPHVNTGSRV